MIQAAAMLLNPEVQHTTPSPSAKGSPLPSGLIVATPQPGHSASLDESARRLDQDEEPLRPIARSATAELLGRPEALTTLRRTARWVCRRRCARDDEDDVFQEMALLI